MNLNGKPTNPGELRTSIELQAPTINKDPGGAQKATWSHLATVWAKWTNAHGQEVLLAQAVESQKLATVLIRYRADVNEQCSILLDGQRYEIIAPPDDIQERHEYMELSVRLVKGSL
jgi:SPP1 family predicted phage head-tail adaptor